MAAGLEGVQAVNRGTGYVTACRGLPRARRAARRVPRRLEVPRLCHAGPIPPSRPPGAVSADPRFRPRAAADVRSGRAVSRATAHPGGDARQMSRKRPGGPVTWHAGLLCLADLRRWPFGCLRPMPVDSAGSPSNVPGGELASDGRSLCRARWGRGSIRGFATVGHDVNGRLWSAEEWFAGLSQGPPHAFPRRTTMEKVSERRLAGCRRPRQSLLVLPGPSRSGRW